MAGFCDAVIFIFIIYGVPGAGVEPARREAYGPKPYVSTSSTTPAFCMCAVLFHLAQISFLTKHNTRYISSTSLLNVYQCSKNSQFYLIFIVRPVGFEPTTVSLKGSCSTRLSYGRLFALRVFKARITSSGNHMHLLPREVAYCRWSTRVAARPDKKEALHQAIRIVS